jgi:hypothetical protein
METEAETCLCDNCNKKILVKKAISCEICNREDDDEDINEELEEDEEEEEEDENAVLKKPKEQMLYCKRCIDMCFVCEMNGCSECVETVCCDCGVSMCDECRNSDELCGCYGNCSTCGRDVNRGSDGWPCGECEIWYCNDCCRSGENTCKECGPDESEEEDEEEDEEEEDEEEEDEEEEDEEENNESEVVEGTK